MKAPKRDYFDPQLKGKSDGQGMEDLPRIISPPFRKPLPKVSSIPVNEVEDLKRPNASLSKLPNLEKGKRELVDQSTTQSTSQATGQSTSQLVNRLVDWSTNPSIDRSIILGRPKAFYITQKQDEDLDLAVEKLNRKIGEKINQKIDRSTVLRLLLEETDIASNHAIDRLASRLVGRLISRLAG